MEAEYRSKCADCGDWIEEGQEIEPDEDGNWVHSDCSNPNDYGKYFGTQTPSS